MAGPNRLDNDFSTKADVAVQIERRAFVQDHVSSTMPI
jgi:hypothetical protein